MRHRSPTNSRPLENLDLRRAYRDENPDCEFHHWFKHHFPDPAGEEVHHIFSDRRRPDLVTNLLTTSRDAHMIAEQFKTDMRVAAIAVKVWKGQFDPDEFKTASGMFVEGWLLCNECKWDWTAGLRLDLIRRFP